MVHKNLLDKDEIMKQLNEGIEHNHPFIVSVIGSQLRGLANNESDIDIGGVFYYTRKNRCSILTKPNTYTVECINNTTLIEVKKYFNHLLQHKPTAFELLVSDQVVYHHSIFSPDNLRKQVFKRFDREKLVDRLFKSGIVFLSGDGCEKNLIRGLYFYIYGLAVLDAVDDFPPNHWVDLLRELRAESTITELVANTLGRLFDLYSRANHFDIELVNSVRGDAVNAMTQWRFSNRVDHNQVNMELRSYLEQYISSIY